MAVPYQGSIIPTCFATCSIMSRSCDVLPEKMKAIRDAGFDAIELAMLAYGRTLYGKEPNADEFDAIVEIAKRVKTLADEQNLKISLLKPFQRVEG
jgi:sugar phosphate isomerase/epimerase